MAIYWQDVASARSLKACREGFGTPPGSTQSRGAIRHRYSGCSNRAARVGPYYFVRMISRRIAFAVEACLVVCCAAPCRLLLMCWAFPSWPSSQEQRPEDSYRDLAMVQNQWYHFGIGAPPILVIFSLFYRGLGCSLAMAICPWVVQLGKRERLASIWIFLGAPGQPSARDEVRAAMAQAFEGRMSKCTAGRRFNPVVEQCIIARMYQESWTLQVLSHNYARVDEGQ